MTQKDLAVELEVWFSEHKRDKENKSRNPVWVVLKDNLRKVGHWRDQGKGSKQVCMQRYYAGIGKNNYE